MRDPPQDVDDSSHPHKITLITTRVAGSRHPKRCVNARTHGSSSSSLFSPSAVSFLPLSFSCGCDNVSALPTAETRGHHATCAHSPPSHAPLARCYSVTAYASETVYVLCPLTSVHSHSHRGREKRRALMPRSEGVEDRSAWPDEDEEVEKRLKHDVHERAEEHGGFEGLRAQSDRSANGHMPKKTVRCLQLHATGAT